ncbi:pyrroline-5-carboxylate reductase [Urbifossiella limnaea]|uniref:Pyrroline-5-carboxylate reductase n=1 Tax=Urbifossiella limnaea TaxID=2528023 RepID=A0A517XZ91_9BACT|nr:pyrroline-5-carboxylate reductase [Urbifossiella limnaea]QDU22834.1 Pyrroline-5-carboxylate reductase [Urbifossiella limnaea]
MDGPFAVGFLGAGQMATALAGGWTAAGLLDLPRCRAADPSPEARAAFSKATGVEAVGQNAHVTACDILVLAVKPQYVADVLAEIRPALQPRHLVISIAAGVTLAQLTAGLGDAVRIVRVMPNTPCLVGASASGYATRGDGPDAAVVGKLFGAVGQAVRVSESQLDAVTGLSGSGPAYVYVMIEALADGGVKAGLPRDVAQKLAAQTVLGAAKMVLDTGRHPGALKDAVASPGGTTIAGLHALERAGVRAALMDAVEAATRRASELGKKE